MSALASLMDKRPDGVTDYADFRTWWPNLPCHWPPVVLPCAWNYH